MLQKLKRPLVSVTAVIGFFAVVIQFYFSVQRSIENGRSLGMAIVHYFSYFTVMTNSAIVIFLLSIVVSENSKLSCWFKKSTIHSAVALYIAIVGLVYNILLINTWNPQGLEYVADRILHDLIPLNYLVIWFLYLRKGDLNWLACLKWVSVPAIYLVYVLIRGAFINEYPYHFLDVNKGGYGAVAVWSIAILMLILLLGLLLIFIDKKVKLA
jgi:hypothetical protein